MIVGSRPGPSPLLLTRVASFVALGVVAGLALSAVPNVELVTATCFCAGYLLGIAGGLLTGALTEAIFAGFHPMGSSIGILLLSQVVGMALAGLAGAMGAALTGESTRRIRIVAVIVSLGVASTVIFDLLTNLAYPAAAGFSMSQTMVALIIGIPFAAIHAGSNLLVFSLIVVPLLPRLQRVLRAS